MKTTPEILDRLLEGMSIDDVEILTELLSPEFNPIRAPLLAEIRKRKRARLPWWRRMFT